MKRTIIILGCLGLGVWSWADVTITQGAGTTIGTDAVGGVNYQKIKLCDGAAGTTTCFSTAPVTINNSPQINNAAGFTVVAGSGTWTVLNAQGFTVVPG